MKIVSKQTELDGYLVDYVAKGTRIELDGIDRAENRDTYRLKLTLKSGDLTHVWVDAQPPRKPMYKGNPGGSMAPSIRWRSTTAIIGT